MRSLIDDCLKQRTMSAKLPRPSAPPGAASGRTVIRSKIGIATQRQRERAFLLAQVDKFREPAINKTHVLSHAALATPSSVECMHCLLQRSAMKQVYVPLRASTLSPILNQPESITELPPTVKDGALPPTVEDVALPPTVEQVARGEQQIPLGDSLIVNQDTAPSTPPSKAAQGQTLDNNNDPYY